MATGTLLDLFLISSAFTPSKKLCPTCTQQEQGQGVISSCLNCFLAGGILCRFEYAVNPAVFLLQRAGTCTLASADPDEDVIHRATRLLDNGFGSYSVIKNNCEDFAIYCKTGLHADDQGMIGQSGQVTSIINGLCAAVRSEPLRFAVRHKTLRFDTSNVFGMMTSAIEIYCDCRYAADVSRRKDVVEIEVEDLITLLKKKINRTDKETSN